MKLLGKILLVVFLFGLVLSCHKNTYAPVNIIAGKYVGTVEYHFQHSHDTGARGYVVDFSLDTVTASDTFFISAQTAGSFCISNSISFVAESLGCMNWSARNSYSGTNGSTSYWTMVFPVRTDSLNYDFSDNSTTGIGGATYHVETFRGRKLQ